ncbi:hypothetical protein BDY17DRAFT_19268 [Neohortaea acidophila]|uniref:Uncharacterized protein n=1 Tax=Neohortaea acidophila TaxID=245834 RepID=A0A6A6Q692_9PEZI|nr:uncharacterized protein BDY17DRAFT_19268 [Neohortaea acidophila]KAF2487835.1 hypothetical protein BDY17DRAFT_19268 [Neohortaea acidophila]
MSFRGNVAFGRCCLFDARVTCQERPYLRTWSARALVPKRLLLLAPLATLIRRDRHRGPLSVPRAMPPHQQTGQGIASLTWRKRGDNVKTSVRMQPPGYVMKVCGGRRLSIEGGIWTATAERQAAVRPPLPTSIQAPST